jgi:pimeloyl-ACP methyl ester carboxylesterase
MTEPITRQGGSERRGRIITPAGEPPAGPATGRVRPAAWFASGRRRPYDPARRTLRPDSHTGLPHVFERVHGDPSPDGHWVSMLPGFPDGSYGWAQVDAQLHDIPSPRLYAEYLGQGDSGKPRNYAYSTIERADLVEALWAAHDVTSTVAVSFDYSSLVVLELLARRLDRRAAGDPEGTRISGVLLVNGGLFADAHSHPWRTTPFMKTRLGGLAMAWNQNHSASFARVLRTSRMWSRGYRLSDEETGDMYDVLARHDGVRFLHDGAGFVDEHKRNAARWDLARLTAALGNELTWDIAGSALDPFEPRQIRAARQRLDPALVRIHDLPGGHLTTSEHPNPLANLIRALPQPRLARPRSGSPPHPMSTEGNQPS